MVRNERFSEEYQAEVRSVVELVATYIVQHYKENPVEARAANIALAHFLKVGHYFFLLRWIHLYSCYF